MSEDRALLSADQAARRRAQADFAAPLVVEAGAGSGKTSILVARVVAWALGPGWERNERVLREERGEAAADDVARRTLSRVVAITFTEAAAAEMAGRVGEWLGLVAAGELPLGLEPEALPAAEVRAARAAPLRAALDRLVVRTIHAWCRRLLAERPLDVGLHPAFEVDADEERAAQIVRAVVEHAIPKAYPDPDAPLSRLAAAGHGPGRVEEALLALVLAGAPSALLAADPHRPEKVHQLCGRIAAACKDFLEIEQGRMPASSRVSATLGSIGDTLACVEAEPAGVAALIEALSELWEDKSVEQLGKWGAGTFGTRIQDAVGADQVPLASAARVLHRCVRHAVGLDPAALELSRQALLPLLREVEERLRTAGVETFAALLRDASRLVGGSERAVARIRAGIDQLLVDEFQDTDALQCEIVGRIGLEGEGERPTLFVVGDPRQSIYGWRSADLRAYDAFVARVEAAGGERLHLSRNFRSLPAVLREVKRSLADCMQPEPGVQPPFQDLVPDRAGQGDDDGRVEHWISWAWDEEARAPARTRSREAARLEARAVAADLARLGQQEGFQWRGAAILLRGMTDVDLYLDALRDAGVPYTVEQDRRYYQRREVIEAAALLRAVLDPHDHVALVAWLRSASVGVPDAAWIPLWARRFPERMSGLRKPGREALADLRALIHEAAAAVPPGLPGHDRIEGWERSLVDAIETLADLRVAAERDASDRFVERLRTATLMEVTEASRYLGAYRVANLDQLFRDVRDDLEETGGDVSEVLRRVRRAVEQQAAVEEARPRDAADEAVRVMSIHKAKGLDFDHVYLVQLHKGSGGDRGVPARVGRGPDGDEYELFGARTLGYDAADEQRARIEQAEQVRTLYVAMTRARDRLVVVGKHPVKGDGLGGSHALLLAPRREAGEKPAERMRKLGSVGDSSEPDEERVLWRFPGLVPEAAEASAERADGAGLPDPARVAEDARRLRERCEAARARAERPRAQAASALSHEAARDRVHARRFAETPEPEPEPAAEAETQIETQREPRDAAQAAAVGTAVHAALERWDARAEPEGALAEARRVAAGVLPALVQASGREAAEANAVEILERFARSELFTRFREIAGHVVARELPVLLLPGAADDAVGHVVGAIDLLYRDPESDEWVVADYKSDDVTSPAEMEERAARYAAQGGAYVRAVSEALGLEAPPRFELWFLSAGVTRQVEISK